MVKGLREMSRSRMELHVHDAIDDHGMDGSRERKGKSMAILVLVLFWISLSIIMYMMQSSKDTNL